MPPSGSSSNRKGKLTHSELLEFHRLSENIQNQISDLLDKQLPTQILQLHQLQQQFYNEINDSDRGSSLTTPQPHFSVINSKSKTDSGDRLNPAVYLHQFSAVPRPSSVVTLGCYPPHPLIQILHNSLKPLIVGFYQLISTLSLSLRLSVNDFSETGNSSLNVPVTALRSVYKSLQSLQPLLRSPLEYHSQRAVLAAKHLKYPENADYRLAVESWDERELTRILVGLLELKSRMLMLKDMISKNEEKIREPQQPTFLIQRT